MSIALEWRRWALERQCQGADDLEIESELVAQGAPRELASATLHELRASENHELARRMARRVKQLEQVTRLYTDLAKTDANLERRRGLSGVRFFRDYYAQNRPVILEDVVARSFTKKFTPAFLRTLLADVEIEACTGRRSDAAPDENWPQHVERMLFGTYLDRVAAAGESNDLYLIANNRVMERAEVFDRLRPYIRSDARYLDDKRLFGNTSLWVGPGGTRTPLHHDTCNILFCQLVGEKTFRIAPPSESAFLEDCTNVYARPELVDHTWTRSVTLRPGDTLFLPVGWWHDVEARAEKAAVSLSFLNFKRTNSFAWYLPGAPDGFSA